MNSSKRIQPLAIALVVAVVYHFIFSLPLVGEDIPTWIIQVHDNILTPLWVTTIALGLVSPYVDVRVNNSFFIAILALIVAVIFAIVYWNISMHLDSTIASMAGLPILPYGYIVGIAVAKIARSDFKEVWSEYKNLDTSMCRDFFYTLYNINLIFTQTGYTFSTLYL